MRRPGKLLRCSGSCGNAVLAASAARVRLQVHQVRVAGKQRGHATVGAAAVVGFAALTDEQLAGVIWVARRAPAARQVPAVGRHRGRAAAGSAAKMSAMATRMRGGKPRLRCARW